MPMKRRRFLQFAGAAITAPSISKSALAHDYPIRPVRLIMGVAAGGTRDIAARLIAQRLSERLGHQFVVESRAGGGGNIATESVVGASPDGYTLLLAATENAINATLYDKLNFNFIRDIEPVASLARFVFVMEVHPLFPAKTVVEFIAYAKANPGKLNMASAGVGNPTHMGGELFQMMAGVRMQHVPYRGEAQALTDLLARHVDCLFGAVPAAIEHVGAGRLRVLGVTSSTRWERLPDVPAIGEFVAGYEASGWYGIGAPRNTPAEIVETLNKEINLIIQEPRITARFDEWGFVAQVGSPDDFGRFIVAETQKWGNVVKTTGGKAN
jgi:tripartite-type tricarboxylate transporter receptor subunit TctC